jgi:hypothetical protein
MCVLALCHWSRALRRFCLLRWRSALRARLSARYPPAHRSLTRTERLVVLARRAAYRWRLYVLRRRLAAGRTVSRPAPRQPVVDLRDWQSKDTTRHGAGPERVPVMLPPSQGASVGRIASLAVRSEVDKPEAVPALHWTTQWTVRAAALGAPRLPSPGILAYDPCPATSRREPARESRTAAIQLSDLPTMLAVLQHASETQSALARLRAELLTTSQPDRVRAAIHRLVQVDATYRVTVAAIRARLDQVLGRR